VLLCDNARPHTAARTRALPEHVNWELFDHPPYSPDLAPNDYRLFTYLKNLLGSQRFNNNVELMEGVRTWLSSQTADFFETGIQELIYSPIQVPQFLR
jgi:histone-lysine N-methyltransferase SETMAR